MGGRPKKGPLPKSLVKPCKSSKVNNLLLNLKRRGKRLSTEEHRLKLRHLAPVTYVATISFQGTVRTTEISTQKDNAEPGLWCYNGHLLLGPNVALISPSTSVSLGWRQGRDAFPKDVSSCVSVAANPLLWHFWPKSAQEQRGSGLTSTTWASFSHLLSTFWMSWKTCCSTTTT